jgi:hypothetical protein
MLTFWLSSKNDPHLRGLWSYPSATYGDGLLLPVLTGTLVGSAWYLSVKPFRKRELWITLIAVCFGFATGYATQVAWLADSRPTLNWTLPRAGHFTSAGRYHAWFLCIMCAVLAALATWLYLQLRAVRQNTHTPNSIAVLILIDGLAFVWLAVHDSVSGGSVALAGASSVVGLAAAVCIVIGLALGLRRSLAFTIRQAAGYTLLVISGSLGTAATILWMGNHPISYIAVSLICAAGVGISTALRIRHSGSSISSAIGSAAAVTMLGSLAILASSPHRPLGPAAAIEQWLESVAVIAAAGIILVGAAYLFHLLESVGYGYWIAFFGIGALVAAAPWAGSATKTLAVWWLSIAFVLMQSVYAVVKQVYRRAASFAVETRHQPPRAPSAVAELLPLGAAALVAYYYFVLSASRAARLETRTSSAPWAVHPWLEMCAVLALCGAAVFITQRSAAPTPPGSRNRASIPWLAITLVFVSVAAWVGLLAFYLKPPPHLWPWYTVAALVVSVLLGILTAESIMVSPVTLQDRVPTPSSRMLAIFAGIAVFASIAWLTLTGTWSDNHAASLPNSLAALGVSLLGGYGIAMLCGVTVAISGTYFRITEDPPWFNALQDQALYLAMGAFGVWSTAVAFGRIPDHQLPHLGVALIQLCSLLAPFAQLFVFVMSNNFAHLGRQLPRVIQLHNDTGHPFHPEGWYKALRIHITVQTGFAILIAVVIVSAVTATALSNVNDFWRYLASKLR